MRGVWSGASTPSHRVMAWACGPLSAVARGTPSAICSAANESSVVSSSASRPRRAASRPGCHRPSRRPARAGPRRRRRRCRMPGCPGRAVVWAMTASLAASAAATSALALAATRVATVPAAWVPERASTSRAARAAARLATSESVEDDTPSHTTSTARPPGSGPRSQRDGILVAGVPDAAVADGRHPGGRLLGEVVSRSSAPAPRTACSTRRPRPHRRTRGTLGQLVGGLRSGPAAQAAGGGRPRSAPQASQNRSPAATGLSHDGQSERPRRAGPRTAAPAALGAAASPSGRCHRSVQRRTAFARSTRCDPLLAASRRGRPGRGRPPRGRRAGRARPRGARRARPWCRRRATPRCRALR